MENELVPDDEKLTEKTAFEDTVFDKNNCIEQVYCPACNRYVPLEFVVAGICKDCFNNH